MRRSKKKNPKKVDSVVCSAQGLHLGVHALDGLGVAAGAGDVVRDVDAHWRYKEEKEKKY